jgi:hypothetical protein
MSDMSKVVPPSPDERQQKVCPPGECKLRVDCMDATQCEIEGRCVRAAPQAARSDAVRALRGVIEWALGEGDDFPIWPETVSIKGNPKFWWRTELRKRYDAALASVAAQPVQDAPSNAIAAHRAIGEFLQELYATMVDPCAEGTMTVEAMKEEILSAAQRQREQLATPKAATSEAKLREALRSFALRCTELYADCDTVHIECRLCGRDWTQPKQREHHKLGCLAALPANDKEAHE